MNATEIESVKERDLCSTYALSKKLNEKHPILEAEVKRRGLSCVAEIAESVHYSKTKPIESQTSARMSNCDRTIPGASSPATDSTPKSIAGKMLPEFYGVYVSGKKLTELQPVSVKTTIGLRAGGRGDRGLAVDGFPAGSPPQGVIESNPTFIMYLQDVNISEIHMSPITVCTDNMQAQQFNILGTPLNSFQFVYGQDYNVNVTVDLWRPNGMIELRIAPIQGKTGMYRLAPVSPLPAGKYALYFGDALHQHDIVFTADAGRRALAYYFDLRH
jgi:hypothetical protein